MSGFSRASLVAVLALAAVLGGCDDPTALLRPPLPDRIFVLMVMEPDSQTQMALVFPIASDERVEEVSGTIYRDGTPVARTTESLVGACVRRHGTIWDPASGGSRNCLIWDFQPLPGTTYRVEIEAAGMHAVSAETTVPDEFEIISARESGAWTGADELHATWRSSPAAYRYLLTVVSDSQPRCFYANCEDLPGRGVNPGWRRITEDTVLTSTVEEGYVWGGVPPWYVEVYALDRHLHDFLTSGSTSDLFPVPPVQNVEGGYGVVGSWVRRRMNLNEDEP